MSRRNAQRFHVELKDPDARKRHPRDIYAPSPEDAARHYVLMLNYSNQAAGEGEVRVISNARSVEWQYSYRMWLQVKELEFIDERAGQASDT